MAEEPSNLTASGPVGGPPPVGKPPGPLPEAPVVGTSPAGTGVTGQSGTGVGVSGDGASYGVSGTSQKGAGIYGGGASDGVYGDGHKNGVHGVSASATDSGVWGENTGAGYGVSGSTNSTFQAGPGGTAAVWGNNAGSGAGVKGTSTGGDGVLGYSLADGHAGVSANNGSGGSKSYGLYASGTPAGHFDGDVEVSGNVSVTGNITVSGDVLLKNQDCAEDFEISDAGAIDPGSVVVIDSKGALKRSDRPYDRRVAGVVSGAGEYKPGIIMGREGTQPEEQRTPVALMGRVYCKVDARYSPIEVGDLLTTSSTPSHAMKAADHLKAFGAVIGKAMRAVEEGQELIPILVALQ